MVLAQMPLWTTIYHEKRMEMCITMQMEVHIPINSVEMGATNKSLAFRCTSQC